MTTASTHSPVPLPGNRFALLFMAAALVLIGGYHALPVAWVEQGIVRYFAVLPGAAILDWLTPGVQVTSDQTRILSTLARLNVLRGCEGTEALLILYAALLAARQSWRATLAGLLLGTLVIFLLNQVRIVALFFIAAHARHLFEPVHGFAAPIAILLGVCLYFLLWLKWAGTGNHDHDRR